jgi:ubiquinone/menaquinone biosynthesis C-methylase UbiE
MKLINQNEQKNIIRSDFDSISYKYDNLKRSICYNDWIINYISSIAQGKNINLLEIGCGTGELSSQLSAYLIKNHTSLIKERFLNKLFITDISPSMLSLAKNKLPNVQDVFFIQSDTSDLATQVVGNKFDIIISKFVLHDYTNPSELINEWLNLLSDNGYLIILDRYEHINVFKRFISYLSIEAWIFRNLFKINKSILKTIKWWLQDLYVWHSKEWRDHQKHENILEYNNIALTYCNKNNIVDHYKLNSRSFFMQIQK